MKSSLSRKERRKIQQRLTLYGNMKKGAAVLGTTVTACSMVGVLTPLHNVYADEVDSNNVVAPYDSDSGADDVQSQTQSPENEEVNPETGDMSGSNTTGTGVEQSRVTEEQQEQLPQDSQQPSITGDEAVQQPQAEQQTEEETPEKETVEEPTQEAEEPEENKEDEELLQEAAEQLPGDDGPAPSTFSALAKEPSAFIEELAGHAKPVASSNNLYASVMIAQAIVESGWGSSTLSQAPNYNLFGIKGSYNGQSVKMPTQEFVNGRYITIKADFRKYPSYTASFQDNAALLSTSLYSGAWKSNTNSYKDATAALTGLYATAPNYNTVLNGIIENYNLTRFDTGNSGGIIDTGTGGSGNSGNSGNSSNNGNSSSSGNPSSNSSGTYTVKSGDSVWLIANKHGITMNQLRSWNNIKNDFVYPDQKLTVKKGSGSSNTGNSSNNSGNNGSSSTSGSTSYTVRSGDSVWLIANKHGITMNQLRSWNNIKNDFVYPGQKLTVKKGGNTNSTSNSNSSSSAKGSYTVKSGDSVWLIANKHGITMNQLRSWNNIKNDFVYPDQKLTVKKGSSSNSSSNSNSSSSAKGSYTVKSGDSVWLIANKHGITMNQLRSWNNIKNDFVYPGQKLTVKKGSGSSNTGNSSNNSGNNGSSSTSGSTSYTVKSGDSVWLIANKHGITMNQLRSWNNIKNDFVYPGQKLTVKKGGSSNSSSNSNSNSSNGSTHKVKIGDSLWMISQKNGISISRLKSINHLTSDTIYIGQTLKVS
ncbi:LysM peptidoglycan-binding domain-containing protein [Tetragenococcus solitarius]|uniref:Peptidoglycan hydrolase n=1 Tax=Tetragenococcus solitarius TaxID=71453 RepID=A0ABN3Y467_9ENTE|nr:LysM peptidoglycan-binding domain-containing protein [Tetragenococcus solitarius]